MKTISSILVILLIVSCASAKDKTYTASTPAGPVVRTFLGIPLDDSIDFIRWKIIFRDSLYYLHCNYGVGKPNTNGFFNGGKNIELSGGLKKEKNIYWLRNGNKILKIAELNTGLLHLLNTDNSLLVGNEGWSYTINNTSPATTGEISLVSKQSVLKDSMTYDGRTPCNIPGIIPRGMECYKLKWRIIFYSKPGKNEPFTYRIFGTPWRKENGITGTWKIINGKDGRITYQLNDEKGKAFLYLLKPDENILLFTDSNGKLLVGDEDFSYTLNRKQ